MAQRNYECMFLLDSGRYATDPQGTEGAVREILTRCHADLVVLAPWQDGKLAYPIRGFKKGLHLLAYFRMDAAQVVEFERLCKLNELILRHLILSHEERLFEPMAQALSAHTAGAPADAPPEPAKVG